MKQIAVHPDTAMHDWIKPDEIDRYLQNGRDFIDETAFVQALERNRQPEAARIRDILSRSLAIETLTLDETAALLNVEDPELLESMRQTGLAVKHKVYDNRIVTFAPLYMSNYCINRCTYCGFRCDNRDVQRGKLTMDDVRAETEVLAGKIGHKRLIVVYGEHPDTSTDYIAETIQTVYGVEAPTRKGTGQIRRVNVNAAPLPIHALQRLREVGIGTYQVFQETYDRRIYREVHPAETVKGHYRWRLYAMHRAMEAGVDDVGLGALFGLGNWKVEVLGLLAHAHELEARFGVGPHTISFPRLEPASGSALPNESPHKVSDEHFKRLVTVIRLAVPYTGMIVTARETHAMRMDAIRRGCTQTDAGTRIGLGAYRESGESDQQANRQQFILGDTCSLESLIRDLAREGIITSFCTAGYRCGRTGGCIMDALKTGKEGKFCKINAVLTFREWLDDFADAETLVLCEPVLQRELAAIKSELPRFYPHVKEHYDRIAKGERDLYF